MCVDCLNAAILSSFTVGWGCSGTTGLLYGLTASVVSRIQEAKMNMNAKKILTLDRAAAAFRQCRQGRTVNQAAHESWPEKMQLTIQVPGVYVLLVNIRY